MMTPDKPPKPIKDYFERQQQTAKERNQPLFGCFNQLDFPSIDFLARQFFKSVFQVAVRGKLNHPVQ
jgi:hypothetical protein